MAGEIVTTTSTGAGLMERRQARVLARMIAQSKLFGGVWTQESTNASTAQFPKIPAPTTVSVATEANATSATAVTISAATATLGAYPFITTPSKLFLGGGEEARMIVDDYIAGSIVLTVDSVIAAVITEANFTTTPINDVVTFDAFLDALAQLENTKFTGTPCFIGSPHMVRSIQASAAAKFVPNANDAMLSAGNVGTLNGVQIFQVPSSILPAATTSGKKSGFMYFKEYAIGFAYRNAASGGLVDFTEAEKHTYLEVAGTAYCAAAACAATAGIICLSDSDTL